MIERYTSYGLSHVCLCPSVASRSPVETDERIEVAFGKITENSSPMHIQ